MTVDLARFQQAFVEEGREALATMEAGLLGLPAQHAPDPEAVNALFRAAHSIKGGAGTFGFGAIARFTHHVETLLDDVRSGRRALSPDVQGLLLRSVDTIRLLLDGALAGQPEEDAPAAEVATALAACLGTGSSPAPVTAAAPAGAWAITFTPHAELLLRGNDPFRLLRELAALGTLTLRPQLDRLPPLAALDPETCYLAWHAVLVGPAVTEAEIRSVFDWVEGDCTLEIRQSDSAAVAPAVGVPAAPAMEASRLPATEATSLRVRTEKLDELMNLVGELVITQSMLGQVGRHFDATRLEQLQAGLAQLERNTRELQESVMRIRMVPISYAFNRFPRLVHDLGGRLGKQVELRFSGEGTELDKTVIEQIGDPLVHVVRNALDHGIETPAERRAAGKPETGVLRLAACHRGGEILIEIADDGRGVSRRRVRDRAIARGVVAPDAVLSDEQVLDLLFHPGFSTADAVSDLSGRGVGMDVVRRNIKALGGSVELQSHEGHGTTLRIRLPLTLAILDGQLARIGTQIYVVPLVAIVESLKIEPSRLGRVAGDTRLYRLRDDYIPVLHADELFGLPSATSQGPSLLMVVEAEGRRAGIVVDELLAQQQVVIKSLEANFRAVPGLSGATILGDGTVALILDVPSLIGLAPRPGTTAESPRARVGRQAVAGAVA